MTEILLPNSSNSTNVKQRDHTLKVLGGGCLIITMCCVAGYIWMAVTTPPSSVGVTKSSDGYPKWSPDGSRIVFVSLRNGNADIYVMDSDGSNVAQLTADPYAKVNFLWSSARNLYPSWSPDGKQIVFSTDRHGDREIYVMDARDGSNQIRLTWDSGNDIEPFWSPDGKHIVFTSDLDGDLDIYIMDADGSNAIQLTHND